MAGPDPARTRPADSSLPGRIVELTGDLIRARGENPGGTEAATVDVIAGFAIAHGLLVHTAEAAAGRPNTVVTAPASPAAAALPAPSTAPAPTTASASTPLPARGGRAARPGLLFLGHSDVVPAGPGWSGDPFEPRVTGDWLTGRGSSDMKGGLAAVLWALADAHASGQLLAPVSLAVTVDEEDLGTGIRHLVADGFGPHAGQQFSGCIVTEPTDLQIVTACRGDTYLEVQLSGIAAHSGRPADGRSAIIAAARLITLLMENQEHLDAHGHPLLGAGSWSPGIIAGGQGTSMVADACRVSIDRRRLPAEDAAQIASWLVAAAAEADITGDGIGLDVEVKMEMPGFITEPDAPLVTTLQAAAEAVTGSVPACSVWTAACDGGYIARDFEIPTLVCGPGSISEQAHHVDESISITEMTTACRIYRQLIDALAR